MRNCSSLPSFCTRMGRGGCKELRSSLFAGTGQEQTIPVGVRGAERNQRWAATCHLKLIKNLPPSATLRALRSQIARRCHSCFSCLEPYEGALEVGRSWGPEVALASSLQRASKSLNPKATGPVIYADERITQEIAKSLYAQTLNLPATVDIRVEAPLCGFSPRNSPGAIQGKFYCGHRTGFAGADPWAIKFSMREEVEVKLR